MEVHSSVLAAIDALDSFKTYAAPLSSSRNKYKKLGATAGINETTSANDGTNATAISNKSTNPNSRQRTRNVNPNSRTPDRSRTKSKNNTQHTGNIANIRSQPKTKTPPRNNESTNQNSTISTAIDSIIPPRLQNDLQTRRRHALDVTCLYNEDGSVECDVPGFCNVVDPTTLCEFQFSSSMSIMDKETRNVDGAKDEENTKQETEGAGSTLGKNGWHRALNVIDSFSMGKTNKFIKSQSSTLDQLTVTHILQNVLPQIDEYDAINGELEYLLKEIKALEKDRVQLEQLFHKAGRDASETSLVKEKLTYQAFRTNLRYMKSEDMKTLPVLWLEDVPLSSPDSDRPDGNNSNRKPYAKLDKPFQDLIRNHRGVGLALLVADTQCKASLIGRCYMNSNYGIGQHTSPSAMLKRQNAATLIDEGGEWLKHCAITGFVKANGDTANSGDAGVDTSGTTYFLKFDNGKTHRRGDLPCNLMARLFRERRNRGSLKYLSTGCSYSVGGGHRCYYAEFDDGECWWGTNKDDVLDKVFMEMDVHRVAFGSTSGIAADKASWVVIGKDGSVKWRNVPQGLHYVLVNAGASATATDGVNTARDPFAAAAPCEVSLGIGGTYFMRFLDGRVDYSLPNFVADVFDQFEADGKLIRGVALHVDTYDCLIRYSRDSEVVV